MSHRFMASTELFFFLCHSQAQLLVLHSADWILFAFRLWRQSRFILPHNSTPLLIVLFKASSIQIYSFSACLWLTVCVRDYSQHIANVVALSVIIVVKICRETQWKKRWICVCLFLKSDFFFSLAFLSICFVISDWFFLLSHTQNQIFFCWNRQTHIWRNTRGKCNEQKKNTALFFLLWKSLFSHQTKKKQDSKKGVISLLGFYALALLLLKLFELSLNENYYFFIIFQSRWCIVVVLIIYCLPVLQCM